MVKINTAAVAEASSQIDAVVNQLEGEFAKTEQKVRSMEVVWVGPASEKAVGRFYYIKNNLGAGCDDIKAVSSFLKVQVGAGYNELEKNISSAASAFR